MNNVELADMDWLYVELADKDQCRVGWQGLITIFYLNKCTCNLDN